MQNAYSIASLIISDHISEGDSSGHASTAVLAAIPEAGIPPEVERSQQRIVTLADWRRIDEEEQRRGKPLGKPREKFTTVESMLQVLD
jgi:adrenodoxin-NADP+ reductase